MKSKTGVSSNPAFKGIQRRSGGQAAWMRGRLRLNQEGLTRNKNARLSREQQLKAQSARIVYGTHNARKMAVRKLSTQQMAKAELAKRKFGKRSTAPDPAKPTSKYRSRGQTMLQWAKESGFGYGNSPDARLRAQGVADRRLMAQGDRAATRNYAKIDRMAIKETGKSRYGATIKLQSRSYRAARMAALRSAAAGDVSGSFSKGLRAGERVRAQRSVARKAAKAIGKPARLRRKR